MSLVREFIYILLLLSKLETNEAIDLYDDLLGVL